MNFACCAFCNIRIFRMCQIAAFSGCSFKAHVRTTSLLTGPVTSAVQRRQDTLPDVSAVCKIPAKAADSASALFPVFQEIDSGCCTNEVLSISQLHTFMNLVRVLWRRVMKLS